MRAREISLLGRHRNKLTLCAELLVLPTLGLLVVLQVVLHVVLDEAQTNLHHHEVIYKNTVKGSTPRAPAWLRGCSLPLGLGAGLAVGPLSHDLCRESSDRVSNLCSC